MNNFVNKFKIPTLLGLALILIGIGVGVFLVLREQVFLSSAAPSLSAKNINISNIEDSSAVISWQTSSQSTSFVTFGPSDPNEQTILDDRDGNSPKLHLTHYVTIKNLLPKTTYQFKIISGRISSEINKFTTAAPLSTQTGFRPIIGSVLDGEKALDEGIVYLSIADATIQSSLVKPSGNFLIPVSQIRKSDLSDIYSLTEEATAKLTIVSGKGQVSALFKLKPAGLTLPTLKLGQSVDLTTPEETPQPIPNKNDLNKYDLNGDGKINAADNSIILQNFGKNPKNEQSSTVYKKADINTDGIVDQKDLDLMAKQINQ